MNALLVRSVEKPGVKERMGLLAKKGQRTTEAIQRVHRCP